MKMKKLGTHVHLDIN